MTTRELVLASLRPLFERADKEGLLFRSHYQGFVLTPDGLRQAHREGRLFWGATNWELISREEYVREAENQVRSAQAEVERRKAL